MCVKKFFSGEKTALGNKLPDCKYGTPLWGKLWVYYMFAGGTVCEYFWTELVRLHGQTGAINHLNKLREAEKQDIERILNDDHATIF